jgi:soluble lytic murein transglycosylase-like protein
MKFRRFKRSIRPLALFFIAVAAFGCSGESDFEGTIAPVYLPSDFLVLSSIEQEDYALALRSLSRADHISQFFNAEDTREATLAFFTSITGSRTVADAILRNAIEHEVDAALAFALAHEESRYKTAAVGHNSDSIDRGLFQLNSKSFPKLSVPDFFDPEKNAKHGMAHLAYCLDVGGNEVAALAMYNAGQTRVSKGGTPRKTLDYIHRITSYKMNLEALFEAQVVAKASPQDSRRLLLAMGESTNKN